MPKPLPWSHSSLSGFETCPRQYEELKVLRNYQDKKNPASIWGDEFHKAAEAYLKGASLAPVMEPYRDYLDKFANRCHDLDGELLVEKEYGLNVNLVPCEFLGPDVWARGIIDVLTLSGTCAYVDDHKTGKNRKKDLQQLIIFALLVFYHHPEIQTAHCAFHWIQLQAIDTETFYRHQIPELWATLIPKLQRYKKSFDVGVFPAKPSGLCKKHCAVESCEYWGRGRR